MWEYTLTESSGYIAQENVYFFGDNQGTYSALVAFVFVNRTLQYLHMRSTDNMVIFLTDRNTVISNFEILKALLPYTLYL